MSNSYSKEPFLMKKEYRALCQVKKGKPIDRETQDRLRKQGLIQEIPLIVESGIIRESRPVISLDGERYLKSVREQRFNRILMVISAAGAVLSAILGLLNYLRG